MHESMEITLYSDDRELKQLCQHIAQLTPGARFTVRGDFRMPPSSPADVCIYDSSLGTLENLPDQQGMANGIVVVSRSELHQVRTKMLHLRAIVLVRPVNRPRLEIAIGQSLCRPEYMADCDLMRITRDETLEYLLHASLRLQEHDQDRAHFLARAVYELRAPLTSVQGYCRLLLDGKVGPVVHDQAAVLGRMWRNVERLSRFISTIFDVTVGRNGETGPTYQVGNIVECIEVATQEIEPVLRDRRIELSVKLLPPDGALCFHDPHVEQVMLNLLENSCRFTERGGGIRIAGYPYFWDRRDAVATHAGDRQMAGKALGGFNAYRVDISDSGPGIPPNLLGRIFAESSQYGGGQDRSGAGLGLAIARMLVQRHQGNIWAESKDSQGVTFSVIFPYVDDGPAALRA